MRQLWKLGLGCILSLTCWSTALADETEAEKVLARLLAAPEIKAEEGFAAKMLVPPGQLYDPLFMITRGEQAWLADDGGEKEGKGSRLVAIDRQGQVSVIAGVGKFLPLIAIGFAPKGFGEFEGQLFALSQARTAAPGITVNHVIQRANPKEDYAAEVFCTLSNAGDDEISGIGADGDFGPEGGPFAGKFFVVTALNRSVYQVTGNGQCTPFVTLDKEQFGSAFGLGFTPDGQTMLISATQSALLSGAPPLEGKGTVVQVSADGTVMEKPFMTGLTVPGSMAFAPDGFGAYAGQLFITDVGNIQAPVPMTQAVNADGKLYRVTPEGEVKLVASGFANPVGVHFIGDKLWVTDINGDFIGGRRELPDGFVVEITAQ